MDENINKRILEEIDNANVDASVKNFLKDILFEEYAGLIGYAYKDVYKNKIKKVIENANISDKENK